jgi:hypothetical protein
MDENYRSFRFPSAAVSPFIDGVAIYSTRFSFRPGRVRIDLYGRAALRFGGPGIIVLVALSMHFTPRAVVENVLFPRLGVDNQIFSPLPLKRLIVVKSRFAALREPPVYGTQSWQLTAQ